MNAMNKEAADNMTDQFLVLNGGYISAVNLSVINQFGYLGRESFTATKTSQTAVATRIIDCSKLIGSCTIKTNEEQTDLQRDVVNSTIAVILELHVVKHLFS